jgi:hypothetical protein
MGDGVQVEKIPGREPDHRGAFAGRIDRRRTDHLRGQPIPDGYELENLTSVPACDCVGAQDNAYVIRETDEFLSSQ